MKKPIRINVKPLSVNEAWRGRRIKTQKYVAYEFEVFFSLPKTIEIPEPPFEIYFKFGLSSLLADWDNCIKQSQDIVFKKYKLNDKLIKRGVVDVENVKKGEEFFDFQIKHYEKNH